MSEYVLLLHLHYIPLFFFSSMEELYLLHPRPLFVDFLQVFSLQAVLQFGAAIQR